MSDLNANHADLLQVQNLVVTYKQRLANVTAVANVSFGLTPGATLALIGESGSGKSTIAKAICGLGHISEGQVFFNDQTISAAPDPAQAAGAAGIQIVFQDPRSSLDPRWPVWRSVIEPCAARYKKTEDKGRSQAIALLQRVGLSEDLADRKPGQLSGGQRQRVTIARAIAPSPKLIILDEAVSALDVSVRNEILALLEKLKNEADLSYLLITHDMGAVVQIASEVAVMYLGKLVEFGNAADVVGNPLHPYTKALISAVPTFEGRGRKRGTQGVHISDSSNPPAGCRYHPRCLHARDICKASDPDSRNISGRAVACHFAETITH